MKLNDPLSNMNGYVPNYHYLYGRKQLYQWPKQLPGDTTGALAYPRYDFSATPSSSFLARGPQTVQQVIYRGYLAAPALHDETALLQDKKHTSWLGLDDVIQQIRTRYEIYQTNMYEVENAKCYAMNSLFFWEAGAGRPADTEQHMTLDKRLEGFYTQQRMERTALWKDVSRLRQLVPESAQKYLSALRKTEILEKYEVSLDDDTCPGTLP